MLCLYLTSEQQAFFDPEDIIRVTSCTDRELPNRAASLIVCRNGDAYVVQGEPREVHAKIMNAINEQDLARETNRIKAEQNISR